MIQLSLSKPNWSNYENDESIKKRKTLLNELESVLCSLMFSAGRSEVRLWLCNSLAGISSISPQHQCKLFVKLLKAKPLKQRLAVQLLQLLFEKQPQKAGSIVAKRSFMLENFFKGNTRRILEWFSNFAGAGGLDHTKGAKALSQFAFVNRDICWEELEWRGKHGQSPAMVATKPHYFLDLDVQQTVKNFLEYVPEFWSSSEFAESLKDGEILCIDKKFFVDMFVDLMYKEDCREVWDVINEFLMEESFSFLCRHLLIVLDEQDLTDLLDCMRKFLKPRFEAAEYGNPSFWVEIILLNYSGCISIDQLLLLNAVIGQARKLLRLVHEEADQDEKEKIKNIVSQMCASSSCDDKFSPIIEECFNRKSVESVKWLGLQSWAIFFWLSGEFQTSESWESLFVSNGIGFRKSDKYRLLNHDKSLEESGSESDESPLGKAKYKKKRRHRKKRRRYLEESYSDELLDIDLLNNSPDLESKAGDWLLSIDQYSTTWVSVDLPEHISKYCFFTWMKWVFAKV